ncbi:STAS domain-containing protein [Actinoplanes sp. L3-i22]|uniref:STAS domain-containing protein n=1 Tax=Actinoplanes sp. L3-i22 TaxID=2836373 RepID=UPI001C85358F|nr:STAS domain-containing protein [Actinoplanes sp. L3-i22]
MIDITVGETPLSAVVSAEAGRVRVALRGEIDRLTGPALADLLCTTLDDGISLVEVQMADVAFVDLEGVRILVQAHAYGAKRGIPLTLRQPASEVCWLLELNGADHLLPSEEDDAA